MILRLMIFACMQSGWTKPPPVRRLVVCAAYLDIWTLSDIWQLGGCSLEIYSAEHLDIYSAEHRVFFIKVCMT